MGAVESTRACALVAQWAYMQWVSSWGVRSFMVLCASVPSPFFTDTVRLYVYSRLRTC